MRIDLTGKRALVTGGNSGIGKAISLALGKAGASVSVNYIKDRQAARDITRIIEADGGESLAIRADVSQKTQVADMFDQVESAWGSLDILVNNAGVQGERTPSWKMDPGEWRQIIDVNLFGTYLCSRKALQSMIPRGSGVILNITSVHEQIPWSGYSAYASSKAAISMLTKTLSQEAAPHGVRVLSLAPGAIKTPINQDVWQDPDRLNDLLEKIPLDRVGEPEDIARLAVVLVSEAAGYITGSSIFVDGGMTDYPDFAHGG